MRRSDNRLLDVGCQRSSRSLAPSGCSLKPRQSGADGCRRRTPATPLRPFVSQPSRCHLLPASSLRSAPFTSEEHARSRGLVVAGACRRDSPKSTDGRWTTEDRIMRVPLVVRVLLVTLAPSFRRRSQWPRKQLITPASAAGSPTPRAPSFRARRSWRARPRPT